MKLLAEMPKIAKCLKCLKLRYSVDFNKYKCKVGYYFCFPSSGIPYAKHRPFIIMTELSDTTILVILNFRSF